MFRRAANSWITRHIGGIVIRCHGYQCTKLRTMTSRSWWTGYFPISVMEPSNPMDWNERPSKLLIQLFFYFHKCNRSLQSIDFAVVHLFRNTDIFRNVRQTSWTAPKVPKSITRTRQRSGSLPVVQERSSSCGICLFQEWESFERQQRNAMYLACGSLSISLFISKP